MDIPPAEFIRKDKGSLGVPRDLPNNPWESVKEELSFFDDGGINLAYNAIDRHVGTPVESKPPLWEGDNGATASYSFGEMARLSNQYANFLTSLGVAKGDRVFLFLPRIPVLYAAFLGILKPELSRAAFLVRFSNRLWWIVWKTVARKYFTTKELSARCRR